MRFNHLAKLLVFITATAIAGCTTEPTTPIQPKPSDLVPEFHVGSHLSAGSTVVKPSSMHGWYFWNDKNDIFTGSPGELVAGPLSPPLGSGGVRLGPLTDAGATAAGHSVIATNEFFGTKLTDITALSYSTYQPGPTLAVALQFDVRYRTTDLAYGGRLVFEPYQNGTVSVGAGWQSWSPLSGTWWASKTTSAGTGGVQIVALPSGNCAQATPCSWAQITAAFPDAVIYGRFLLKAGSNWNGFDGNADALTIGVSGTNATFDFEPETPCTTVCYADVATGNDAFGGDTPASAKKTIQAAINQVSAGGEVRVLPGTYNETAPGSAPTSLGGTYQFGLFFGSAKPGITLMGVTAADVPIANAAATLATINTDATNNFGTSGIFVEAANTTIRGVTIGPNLSGDNKTIEVVADNFTLQYSATAIPDGGAIYLSEFDPPAGAVSIYHILDNQFTDFTQIAISSGAGQGGPVSGREIKRNIFALGGNPWPSISFNGTGGVGGVPWFTKPVGGAIITNNSFSGGGLQYIRARGTYTEAEFDWHSYWQDNTYDKGTVALLTEAPFDVRSFSYVSGYTFMNVRRIGTTIQGEVDNALAGDVVLAKAGSYPEQVVVSKDITVKGAGQAQTLLLGSACTGNGISLGSTASGATVQDLGISGFNLGIQIPTGPLSNITVADVTSSSNCLHGIWVQAFGTTNFAFTRVTANSNGIGAGGRGIWMINGVRDGVGITDGHYNNNGLVGIDLSDGSATNVTITGNEVVGNKDSGIGVLGAKGPGANLVSNNTVTDNGRYGIEMKIPTGNGSASGPGSVVVSNNVVTRTATATDARDYAGIAVFRRSVDPLLNADQPTGVVVTGNTVGGFTRKPSGSTGDGFGIVVEGTGHIVTENLVSGNDIGVQIQSGNTANVQSTPYFDRGDAVPSSALINRNSITSNSDLDLRNVGAGLTDATCNWYGAATGPAAVKLSGSLTTNPWLTTSNLTGACGPDNQGPLTSLTPPAPAPINTAILLGVSISDLTTGNSPLLSYTWSRDGGTQGTFIFGTSAVTQNFAISVPADVAADVDNICVKGTDVFGNIGPEVCVLAVWYDPTAGFVTGGGWINSPIGAYTTDPSLTGRANFGFVSKYQKGKTLPSGNTEFQFQAANLNFKSTAFDWLVVSGARAQYKGVGTINGTGNYSFMLTAIDGQTAGGGGTDKFRMKIWGSSGLVYDNSLNAPDTSDPTTVLGGGNIMIHK
jgi:hypothetical protein